MVEKEYFTQPFLDAIKTASLNDDKKFVIILGSGFHSQYLNKKSGVDESDNLQMLCDWRKLIQPLAPNYQLSGHYLRDFEDIIARSQDSMDDKKSSKEKDLAAFKIEKKI